jgi:hypothetical protein
MEHHEVVQISDGEGRREKNGGILSDDDISSV